MKDTALSDGYNSNLTISNDGTEDDYQLSTSSNVQKELEEIRAQLQEKSKSLLEITHKYENTQIENNSLKEENKNMQKLIQFYKDNEQLNDPENKTDENKIKELGIKVISLEGENEKLMKINEEKEENIKELKESIEEEKYISEQLIDKLQEKESIISSLKQEIESNNSQSKNKENTQEELQALTELYKEKEEENEELVAQINNLNQKVDELKTLSSDLQAKYSDREAEANDILSKKHIWEAEKKLLEEQILALQEKSDNKSEYLTEIDRLQNQIRELRENKVEILESSQNQEENHKEKFESLQRQYNELMVTSAKNEEIVGSLREQVKKLEGENEDLKGRLGEKERESLVFVEKIGEKNAEIDGLNAKISEITQEKSKKSQAILALEKKHKESEERFNILKEEMRQRYEKENSTLLKTLNETKKKLEKANKENRANKFVTSTVSEGLSLDSLLSDPKEQLKDQLNDQAKQINDLKNEIKFYEKRTEELKTFEVQAKKAKEYEAQNMFLNNTIENLKKNIEDIKAQKLKEENNFRAENLSLENELSKAKCTIAMNSFNFDKKIIKYKNLTEKMKKKLMSLGVKFVSAKNKNN